MEHEWKQYKRKGVSEMRPYIKGEDLSNISVAVMQKPEEDMGMIARDPKDHTDQWYVTRKYFEENLEEVKEVVKSARLPYPHQEED